MSEEKDTTPVEYRDVPIPTRTKYRVGDDGTVWRFREARDSWRGTKPAEWKPVTRSIANNGYESVSLWRGEVKEKRISVHRLVLLSFIGPPPEGTQCCHCNGIKTDNRLSNLRYDTPKANCADRARHGKTVRGSRNSHAVLDEQRVLEMRRLRRDGASVPAIAEMFGVRRGTAKKAILGTAWNHVPSPARVRSDFSIVLDEQMVREMRRLRKSGERVMDIAKKFGVHRGTVGSAISGRSWKHVT